MEICIFLHLFRFPYSGLSKAIAALSMVVGILLIAFPVTVLSINFGDVYNDYRVRRSARIRQAPKEFQSKEINRASLDKIQLQLLTAISEDITITSKKTEDIASQLANLVELHSDIYMGLDVLRGIAPVNFERADTL